MLVCFPPPQALDKLSLWNINNHQLITECIQSKIEGVRSNIYINIVPFVWNSMFTVATSSLLIQNFSTHLKVLLMALTGTVGFVLFSPSQAIISFWFVFKTFLTFCSIFCHEQEHDLIIGYYLHSSILKNGSTLRTRT